MHKYIYFFILPNSQHCSAQAVPPLLTTSVLEYSTELSKASLHYWTPWILNYRLKHSSKVLSFLRLYQQFLSTVQLFNYPSITSSHVLKTMSLYYSIHRNSAVVRNWYLFQSLSHRNVTSLLKAVRDALHVDVVCEWLVYTVCMPATIHRDPD